MICYHDKSFCIASFERDDAPHCVNEACSRCITEADRALARRLELPFSLSNYRHADCGYRGAEASAPAEES